MPSLAPTLTSDQLLALRTVYLRDLYTAYVPANPPNSAVPEVALSVFNMTAHMNFFSDADLQNYAANAWYDNESSLQQLYDVSFIDYSAEHADDVTVADDAVTLAGAVRLNRWLALTAAAALTTMLMDGRFMSAFSTKSVLADVIKLVTAQIKALRWRGVGFQSLPTVRS